MRVNPEAKERPHFSPGVNPGALLNVVGLS